MNEFLETIDIRLAVVFAAGLFVGRFLNLCIVRFPQDDRFLQQLTSLFRQPRACRGCQSARPWWQMLPLVSWLPGGAACGKCRRRLPRRFAVVELLTAGLLATLFYCTVTHGRAVFRSDAYGQFFYFAVMICGLIVATFIDIDLKIIPDGSTIPPMAVGLLGGWLLPHAHLTEVWYQDPYLGIFDSILPPDGGWPARFQGIPEWVIQWPHLHGLVVSGAGLVVGGGIVWVVRILGRHTLGREAMGFGDVILLAMIGSFVGWQAAVIVFFLAPLCALVSVVIGWIFLRNREIPFGPYLSLAAVIVLFGWNEIWLRTEQIFGLGVFLPILGLLMLAGFASLLGMMRGVQRMLGIEPESEWIEEWTSGDQLSYLAGEVTDVDQGQWRRESWPGVHAGRGTWQGRQWRGGR